MRCQHSEVVCLIFCFLQRWSMDQKRLRDSQEYFLRNRDNAKNFSQNTYRVWAEKARNLLIDTQTLRSNILLMELPLPGHATAFLRAQRWWGRPTSYVINLHQSAPAPAVRQRRAFERKTPLLPKQRIRIRVVLACWMNVGLMQMHLRSCSCLSLVTWNKYFLTEYMKMKIRFCPKLFVGSLMVLTTIKLLSHQAKTQESLNKLIPTK